MKMFVFKYVDQVSYNYHSGGGLMVVAKDKSHVEELIKDDEDIFITEEEWGEVLTYELQEDAEPQVLTFPDAGCC